MEVEEYIRLLMMKNPSLNKGDDEVVSLRVRGLKNVIRQAYRKGREAAADPYPELNDDALGGGSADRGANALWEKLFGKGLKS